MPIVSRNARMKYPRERSQSCATSEIEENEIERTAEVCLIGCRLITDINRVFGKVVGCRVMFVEDAPGVATERGNPDDKTSIACRRHDLIEFSFGWSPSERYQCLSQAGFG